MNAQSALMAAPSLPSATAPCIALPPASVQPSPASGGGLGWGHLNSSFIAAVFLLAAVLLVFPAAQAHSVGTSYLVVETTEADVLQVRVDLSLRDLEFAIGLDANHDARITWAEVQTSDQALNNYIADRVHITRGDEACKFGAPTLQIATHGDGPYAVMTMPLQCALREGALALQSNLLFDIDDSHRSLLQMNIAAAQTLAVLTAGSRHWREPKNSSDVWTTFARFIAQGVWHIWTGFDHLAFLMLLLLPLARDRSSGGMQLVGKILRVVTAFTLAHSLTLACAAFGYVQLPSRWVEAVIAASIVMTGLLNLLPRAAHFGVAMAFGFGLVHGFGFASALAEIAGNSSSRLVPLLGFNLGVEVGQLIVVMGAFPLLWLLTITSRFPLQRYAVPGGSLAIGLVGLIWLIERTLI